MLSGNYTVNFMPRKSKVTIVYERSNFEALHEKGAVRFGADWIRANEGAVDVLRKFQLIQLIQE